MGFWEGGLKLYQRFESANFFLWLWEEYHQSMFFVVWFLGEETCFAKSSGCG